MKTFGVQVLKKLFLWTWNERKTVEVGRFDLQRVMITHFECMILRCQTVFLGPRSLQKNARKVQKVDYDWVI